MRTINFQADFKSWRRAARGLLISKTPPDEVFWDDGSSTSGLFSELSFSAEPRAVNTEALPSGGRATLNIPAAFLGLAEQAACHRDVDRWSLLYKIAWRILYEEERHLLKIETDPEVRRINLLAKEVRRDRHKMTAFVRFRKVGECSDTSREQFVAWFEPDHHIVELTAPFFAKRFAGMDWSILTPEKCVHWNGDQLQFSDGVQKSIAPSSDELDDYWRTYYASIFNPARLKLKAMQSEMPVKYWKNLPEAPLIRELTVASAYRTRGMIDRGVNEERAHVSAKVPRGVPNVESRASIVSPAEFVAASVDADLDQLRDAAACCRGCPLHENATRTVFGVGPQDARIMIVGEQPGDREDLIGEPFVGPAGQLLNRAMAQAGIDRSECYLTNTVKHFKWQQSEGSSSRGKQRLHRNPSASEVQVCKPWVIAEAMRIRPRVLICLGAIAAKALIRSDFRVLAERGKVAGESPLAAHVVATVHPSSLLRWRDGPDKIAAFDGFVGDLKLAARLGAEE